MGRGEMTDNQAAGIRDCLNSLMAYCGKNDWAGFDARLRLSETFEGRKQVDGRLGGVEGDLIVITTAKTREMLHIPYAIIASAKLLLTDALIKATAPLSAEGADMIFEER